MAADVVPALSEAITTTFQTKMASDRAVARVSNRIRDGTATLVDGHLYAEHAGKALSAALKQHLRPENLPDGKLYYNIGSRTILPALKNNHKLVNKTAADIQKVVDKDIGINIAAVESTFPEERAIGLVDKAVEADPSNMLIWLAEPIINITEAFFDDYVRENAQTREYMGLQTTITRIVAAGCCEWCSNMGGSWKYGTEPKNIYRRHEYCRCTVTYESDRTRQNVWSKRQWEATPEEILERRTSGRPAGMTMQERINVVDQIERDQVVRWYMNATGASRDLALRKTQGRSLKEIRSMITTALRR